jgi:hypothetical protein
MTDLKSLSGTSLRISESRPRPTPPPAGRKFRDAMAHAATRLLAGVEATSPLLPGGALVGLAARGVSSRVASTSSMSTSAGALGALGTDGATGGALSAGANETLELLALQREIGLEQQRYGVMSAVLKARHETARNVIQNVR